MLIKLTIIYTIESQKIKSTTIIRIIILNVDEIIIAHIKGAAGLITY